MSDTVIVAIIVAAPTLIATLIKFQQDRKEYRRSLNADNTANSKLDHITVLTNSTLTTANTEIGNLKQQNRQLQAQVQELLDVIKNERRGDAEKAPEA